MLDRDLLETEPLSTTLKWMGQRVAHTKGLSLDDVAYHLPTFERQPFGDNEYLDQVIRQPFREDARHIPVAAVSKRYALIQHQEFIGWMKDGIKRVGLKPEDMPTELWLTDYGERMRLRFKVSFRQYDPGDACPVVLAAECFNSVDRSCALEVRMAWLRIICMNGLMVKGKSSLRKIHDVVWMSREDPAEFLSDQLALADENFEAIRAWVRCPVTLEKVGSWADEFVADAWGVEIAARIYHIARTGYDGIVERHAGKLLPHLRIVRSELAVPGAAIPARNLFDVSQALSWIAGRRDSMEDQINWVHSIPMLIQSLT